MPVGYLIGTGLIAIYVLFALAPPKPGHTSPVRVSFWLGYFEAVIDGIEAFARWCSRDGARPA